jgi:diguanylate cyclase (GGDEF)-like protein
MIVVALVPVVLVAAHLTWSSWDKRWQEVQDQQHQLATNLSGPLSSFFVAQHDALAMLAGHLLTLQSRGLSTRQLQHELNSSLDHLPGLQHIAWLSLDGRIRVQTNRSVRNSPVLSHESTFNDVIKSGHWVVSGVKTSPFTKKSSVLLGQPVLGSDGGIHGVLLAEIKLQQVEKFRQQINFAETGYAVIVDQYGRVVAHPNQDWVRSRKDLSDWPVVSPMLAGKSGIAEFYSKVNHEEIIAGYAPVSVLGWGVMMLQPKADVSNAVLGLISSNIAWSLFALLLAVGIAFTLACWITRPVNNMVNAAQQLLASDLKGDFAFSANSAPKEINALGSVLATVVNRLQRSRQEVQVLNKSLQKRVQHATEALQKSNAQLKKQARRDYLTTLPNRRFFESNFQEIFHRRRDDAAEICLMLIDVDHFKEINDQYGHAAGDAVLTEIATTLDNMMRPGDVVARYGGDEFVVQMRCNHSVGLKRAEQIRESIESRQFEWDGATLQTTVSVGVYNGSLSKSRNLAEMVKQADAAMYEAKRGGRNNIVEIRESSAA